MPALNHSRAGIAGRGAEGFPAGQAACMFQQGSPEPHRGAVTVPVPQVHAFGVTEGSSCISSGGGFGPELTMKTKSYRGEAGTSAVTQALGDLCNTAHRWLVVVALVALSSAF